MMNIKRISVILSLLIVCISASACGSSDIERVVFNGVVALRAARKVTTLQYKANDITADEYKSRLILFKDIHVSVNELDDALNRLMSVGPENRAAILKELDVAFEKVDKLIASGNLRVRNPESQTEYRNHLAVARMILSNIKTAIEALKNQTPVQDVNVKGA